MPVSTIRHVGSRLAVLALLAACREATMPPAPRATPGASADVTTQGYTVAWFLEPGGVAVANDAADNTYTARWDYNPGGDIYVAKRSVSGALLWEVKYDNTDPTRHEVATWVATDGGGNVVVSGTIRSGYSSPVNANSLVMKFSPSGQLLWRKVYAAPFDGSYTRKVLVDAADNVYVFGLGMTPTGQRTTIRKFSSAGALVWSWFDPVGIGAPLNIKWGRDGSLLVAARGTTGSVGGYARVSQGGQTLWTLAPFLSLSAGDLAGDATGNVYLINGNYTAGSGSLLRKVDPAGNTLWQQGHPMTGTRVEVGSDQNPVIAGTPVVGYGAAFAKFSAAGNPLWTNLDADGPAVALLAHGQMRLDAQDNAYLAASNMSQMGVTKVLGSTGASDWTALIPYGYATSLAFGQGGRVFVTGGGTTALIEQGGSPPPPPPPPPPTNTSPTVSITPLSATTIARGTAFQVSATFADPDAGDGPWTYKWRWSTGSTSGSWTAPGSYQASRTYPASGTYKVSLIVTDARGAQGTSNAILVTVQ